MAHDDNLEKDGDRLRSVEAILTLLSHKLCGTGHRSLCALLTKEVADHVVLPVAERMLSGNILLAALLELVELLLSQKSSIPFERALLDEAHLFAKSLKGVLGRSK